MSSNCSCTPAVTARVSALRELPLVDIKHQAAALRRGTTNITPANGLEDKLAKSAKTGKPLVIKLGLDPTAPDIHIGHGVVLRKMRQFQDFGHKVVVIIGDFTGMIGDPTGRSETRKQLTREQIAINAQTYADQYNLVLDPTKTEVRFNSEWLGALNFFDVIHLAGTATVAQIMERDDFKRRFSENQAIGLHELMYPLCQAYDSVALESDVEMGGTDQMFNILTARDAQAAYGQDPQVALFMPILVGLDGVQKMSKSLGNYVGITEAPTAMFGKLMSITDDMMLTYFELCTDVPMDEVNALLADMKAGRAHPKDVKRRLAREIVTIYHNASAADEADAEFERVHARREAPTDIPERLLPVDVARDGKVWVCKLLVALDLAKGTSDARRLVQQGGVQVNGAKVTDPAAEYGVAEIDGVTVQVGSRNFARVKAG
jgi:tyrosyl-tRNA synthetase